MARGAGPAAQKPQCQASERSRWGEVRTPTGGRPQVRSLGRAALTQDLRLFLELDIVSFINSTHF